VQQGDAFSVSVSIDSNLIDRVQTRVAGTTLIVSVQGSIWGSVDGPHVSVTMPVLSGATASGSGGIRIHPFTQDMDMTLEASGSGGIDAEAAAPRVRADASGSGDIRVRGSAQRIEIDASGSGGVDSAGLPAAEGAISLSGSGGATATIHDSADISITGSGDLDLFGGAQIAHLAQSGSGRLHVHP
jgi:Putative auto-transporter adhesin, head GIN domain